MQSHRGVASSSSSAQRSRAAGAAATPGVARFSRRGVHLSRRARPGFGRVSALVDGRSRAAVGRAGRAPGEMGDGTSVVLLGRTPPMPLVVRALKAGAVDVLCKPVELPELRHAVLEAFERNDAARQQRSRMRALQAEGWSGSPPGSTRSSAPHHRAAEQAGRRRAGNHRANGEGASGVHPPQGGGGLGGRAGPCRDHARVRLPAARRTRDDRRAAGPRVVRPGPLALGLSRRTDVERREPTQLGRERSTSGRFEGSLGRVTLDALLTAAPPWPRRVVCLTEETTETLYRSAPGTGWSGCRASWCVRPRLAASRG